MQVKQARKNKSPNNKKHKSVRSASLSLRKARPPNNIFFALVRISRIYAYLFTNFLLFLFITIYLEPKENEQTKKTTKNRTEQRIIL